MGTSNKYTTSGNTNAVQFNPSSPYYKTCCCHVRKFTVTAAIVEIFLICFMLVAVIPDLSSKICEIDKPTTKTTSSSLNNYENSDTNSSISVEALMEATQNATEYPPGPELILPKDNSSWYNYTGSYNQPFLLLRSISCNFNMGWLILALIKIIAANIMFYGIKSARWYLFIPHIFCRVCCILIVVILCLLLIIGCLSGPISSSVLTTAWITSIFGFLFCIFYIYIVICQVKCCQFVKKSHETGISYSSTRPVGPATLSNSESRPPAPNYAQSIPMATFTNQRPISGNNAAIARGGRGSATFDILPPLRHSYGVSGVGK